MNNIIPFPDKTENIFFPVTIQPLESYFSESDNIADPRNLQAVVREDTQELLAVHGSTYRLVKNDELFPRFEEALEHSPVDTNGAIVTDQISNGGGRCFRTYRFPEHRVKINGRDEVDLQLNIMNSYDGSSAFIAMVGAYRLLCMNGMVIGEQMHRTYAKHTLGLNIEHTAKSIERSLHIYLGQTAQWKAWRNRPVTDTQAMAVFESLPNGNEHLSNTLFGFYQDETNELGPNVWALFNALTYWSTHADIRESAAKNRPAIVARREQQVRATINSPEFLKLAA